MPRKISLYIVGFVMAFSLAQGTENPVRIWPLQGKIDFSSGYGDYRPGRFHLGLDYRTQGKHLPVYAPVAGSVAEVWVQYNGYGKALYFRGDDGLLYVFGHLSSYAPRIDSAVRNRQISRQRYSLRDTLAGENLRFRQGEMLAHTGSTGVGPPHLHFETRNGENVPLSPIGQKLYDINDDLGPVIKALGIQYLDQASFHETGSRSFRYSAGRAVVDGPGRRFVLNATPYIDAPTGFWVEAEDYPTNKSFGACPREFSLSIEKAATGKEPDGNSPSQGGPFVLFSMLMDSLTYTDGPLAGCLYDQGDGRNGEGERHLLYSSNGESTCLGPQGQILSGKFPPNESFRYGLYRAVLKTRDASGNSAQLDFSFFYGPAGDLFYRSDVGPDYAIVTPLNAELCRSLGVRSVVVLEWTSGNVWREYTTAEVARLEGGAFRITLPKADLRRQKRLLRILARGNDGWTKSDVILTSFSETTPVEFSVSHRLSQGGIFFEVQANRATSNPPTTQAICVNGNTIDIALRQNGMSLFQGFLQADSVSPEIVGFRSFAGERTLDTSDLASGLHVYVVPSSGSESARRVAAGNGTFYGPAGGLNTPRFIEMSVYKKTSTVSGKVLAGPFQVGPTDFRYDNPTQIGFRKPEGVTGSPINVSVAKLIANGERWEWLATTSDDSVFWAETNYNGVFALLSDSVTPVIETIIPVDGATVKTRRPAISSRVWDGLSGVSVDTLWDVRLDGEWLIPEYDIDEGLLTTSPNTPLTVGRHELVISVRDRAGNATVKKTSFIVQ